MATLRRLLAETESALARAQHITGDERDMVLADLSGESRRLADAIGRLTGKTPTLRSETRIKSADAKGQKDRSGRSEPEPPPTPTGPPLLQASWTGDTLVVWGGGPQSRPADQAGLEELLAGAGTAGVTWEPHGEVTVPGIGRSYALQAPMRSVLGWLVAVGAGQVGPTAGPSLRWLGEVAAWATRLVVQGRAVPTLDASNRGGRRSTAKFEVRWAPAAVEPEVVRSLAERMPGAVAAAGFTGPAGAPLPGGPVAAASRICRSLLGAAADSVCRAGAARLVTAATVPVARSRSEVAEAILAGLNGEPFTAVSSVTAELAEDLRQWAAPVLGDGPRLTVRLEPPERDGGWLLGIEAPGPGGAGVPVERIIAEASPRQVSEVEAQLRRLARLLPALKRVTRHQGQVVLDGGEAWELMTSVGPVLVAAGFDVAVPALSKKRPSPRLQLHAEALRGETQVGAAQLSSVRWSVVVDDVELDAADINRLSSEARPLVRVRGRWVELDRADLKAAAEALADRSKTTQLSGAAILRHAVGLEGGPLAGPVSVTGGGWAVDIVKGATGTPVSLDAPKGFKGTLRHYQAEARGWVDFLDKAGLGGCLALDMGLGKTPTVLAQILDTRDEGPSLVIAPPAVLGNWAAEAERFTPGLKVHVHHGAARAAGGDEVADVVAGADIVLTTYATGVRDVEALAGVEWHRLVIDEAQAIKNPASETAQQLRRIPARLRLALTGTPVENGLGDLWSILDFVNPGLVGTRTAFVEHLSGSGSPAKSNGSGGSAKSNGSGERALRALNGLLVFRRTKAEPDIAAELPDKIDELDHCTMTSEQVGLYQAVLDQLLAQPQPGDGDDEAAGKAARKGHILAAITALKQICDHPAAYLGDEDKGELHGRSGKLARLEELMEAVFEAGERMLIFTHFARWGERLATHLSAKFGQKIDCYHGGLPRTTRDRIIEEFQAGEGAGALVLSIKAGGSGLNLTAASHVVLYDRWWNPAVEDQARDRAWRIGQRSTVICHRLVCPGTVDERVEEVVAGKRRVADLVLPASSSLGDLGPDQLRVALGLGPDALVDEDSAGEKAEAGKEAAA